MSKRNISIISGLAGLWQYKFGAPLQKGALSRLAGILVLILVLVVLVLVVLVLMLVLALILAAVLAVVLILVLVIHV